MSHLRFTTWSLRAGAFLGAMACLPLTTIASWPDSSVAAGSWNAGPGVVNHPVNVAPSAAVLIPAGWPLSASGTLTCLTCHTSLPRDKDDQPKLRGEQASRNDARQFCTQCHRGEARSTASGMHWVALDRAHFGGEHETARGAERDDGSRRCLSCHDGVSAPDTPYQTGGGAHSGDLGEPGRNHPIGVRYPWGGKRGGDSSLRPASLLPKTVQLPRDNVGCVSCHNLYANSPKLLSVPIEGSALCFTCHDMK